MKKISNWNIASASGVIGNGRLFVRMGSPMRDVVVEATARYPIRAEASTRP